MTKATKALVVLSALSLLVALAPRGVRADEEGPAGVITDIEAYDKEMREDYVAKSIINKALRKTAEGLVAKNKDTEAEKYLKLSEAAAAEGERHYSTGEYGFALEDVAESTRLANYAIVMASEGNGSLRDAVIKDRGRRGDERAHERKEARIRKGIAEAEIFIQTASRLLKDSDNPGAQKDLEEASRLLKESRSELAAERYDSALEDLDKSYRLATKSVREIKGALNEPLTFPKPRDGNVDEVLKYELKRNQTYLFLTRQYAPAPGSKAMEDVRRAMDLSAEANGAITEGKKHEAIRTLKESTALLVRALNPPAE